MVLSPPEPGDPAGGGRRTRGHWLEGWEVGSEESRQSKSLTQGRNVLCFFKQPTEALSQGCS